MLWLDYYWHKVLKRPYTLAKRIDRGRGQPVVFLHGIASTGEGWRSLSEQLDEKHYHSIAFDLLGFGESPQPDWLQYSVDDHATAVIASLRRMRIRKPVVLVGHSMGSLVAAHIAREYPGKVKQLILYQMPVYGAVPKLEVKDFRRQAYLSAFRYLAEHPKVTLWYARVLGRVASKLGGFILTEKTWQPFELSLRNTIMQQQSYEDLRKLKMPTDVIYGKYDILVLKKNLRHFFHPSRKLRFYEIDEIHRISVRAGKLIQQLITNTAEPELDSRHTRIVEWVDMEKLEKVEKTKQPRKENRQTWALIGATAAIVFVALASVAWHNHVPEWELSLFQWLNGWQAPAWVDAFAHMASGAVWAIVFLTVTLLLVKRYAKAAWRVAVPGGAAYVAVYIMEHIVQRGRPEAILQAQDFVLRASQDGYGFPSGHMGVMTAVAVTIWPYLSTPLRVVVVLLTVSVGWSRIYLGVHFPLDIASGFLAGVMVVSAVKLTPQVIRKKLKLL